jgi:tetratricopeptide (TPR) repeat protein
MFDKFRYTLRGFITALTYGQFFRFGRWSDWVPFWLTPRFFWLVLTYPVRWFFTAWNERQMRHLLFGMPVVVLIVGLAMLFHSLRLQARFLPTTYWEESQKAFAAQNYQRAELLLDRVLQEQGTHVNDAKFLLALTYSRTDRAERSQALFLELAPDDTRGHRGAHLKVAIALADGVTPESTQAELNRLKWHLEAAGDPDVPETSLAWGRYALAIGDLKGARTYFEKAVVRFPELWKTIADVNLQMGNHDSALAGYEKAAQYLTERLESAKGLEKRAARFDYATVLMRVGRLDDARVMLETGLKDDPEGEWKQLLAALYVHYHDLLSLQGGHPIGELLEPIAKSLEYEPNFGLALNRLMAYVDAKVEGNIELRNVLARVVAEGKEPALAHLALGNLCWIESDTESAIFHFERAIEINGKLASVMNNLAWLLATSEQAPDLDRALGLIDTALASRPEDPDFLDTRGTVLMKLGRKREALKDLEKAIFLRIASPGPVHRKLATLYEELGMVEMAEQHRLLDQHSTEKTTAGQLAE